MPSLKIGQKLWIFPILSAVTLAVVGAIGLWSQSRLGASLRGLRDEHLPRVAVGQRLNTLLDQVQQAFGSAAAAQDRELLADADARLASMKASLEDREGRALPALRRQRLSEAMDAYGAAAHALTEALITNAPDATARIGTMQAKLANLRQALEAGLTEDSAAMDAAFQSSDATLRASNRVLLGVAVALLLLSLLTGFSLQRAITRPLERLTTAARRVAHEQDLTHRVEWQGSDELAELAGAFDAMVVRLREIMNALLRSVASLDSAATDMRTLAAADTAAWQLHAQRLGELSQRTAQLAGSSRLAASRAEAVLASTLRAESLGAQGRQAVDDTSSGLSEIRTDVSGLVEQIHQMVGHAAVVGGVIGEVQELAKQSNVLALNASIEAARAGEAGLAFAVVAREMRRLADESSRSTSSISRTLLDIVGAARSLQALSRESDQRIHASNERVQASGASLRDLVTLYAESGGAAREIVGAVASQDRDLAGVSQGLDELDRSMAASVQSVQRLETSSEGLTQASQELSRLLSQFRL